ncbi:hypothetical protein [Paracoccus pantotrophus]|uniref:hypothetical protein n=1 Tax=Paracoccus pantotrophus TaxID=82367 RepID=UPI00048A5C18|nr:hypothetical protein [Paracoccus pantotrophus]
MERPLVGILFRAGSAACLVATGICVKTAPAVPIGEAMFVRSASALFFIIMATGWRGSLGAAVRTRSYGGHLGRGLIGAMGIFFMFGAFARLPITEITTMP